MDMTKQSTSNNNNQNNYNQINNNNNHQKMPINFKVNNNFASLESLLDSFGPNYNWDECRKIDNSYYQPLQNQLENMSFSLFNNIINSQIETNKEKNTKF